MSRLSRHVDENGINVSIRTPIPVPYNHPYRVILRAILKPFRKAYRWLRLMLLAPGGDNEQ